MVKKSGIYFRETIARDKELVYIGTINSNGSFRYYTIIASNKKMIQLPTPDGEDDIAFVESTFSEQSVPVRRMKKDVFKFLFEEKWYRGNI
jgi:hypothetical protein